MSPAPIPVTVAGSGPAAWAIAAALATRGVEAVLVAPAPEARWRPTYGCWADDLVSAGLDPASVGRPHDRVVVHGARTHRFDRPYVVVDNDALRAQLVERASSVAVRSGTVRRIRDRDGVIEVTTGDGTTFTTTVVIDATGAAPAVLTPSAARRPVSVQAAYGLVARFDRPPAAAGAFTMMDWTPAPEAAPRDPSFLYAFERGDGWWLAEETSLARSPSMSLGELRRRLERRLATAGCTVLETRTIEEVAIPMGVPVPPAQLAVGFGAAGGLVHPATGYSLGASLAAAPLLADVVADELAGGARPAALAAACWSVLWPTPRRRARALHEYGLDVLLRLDAPATAAFFDTFFELPPEQWRAYLDPRVELDRLVEVMQATFRAADWRVRTKLAAGDPRRLVSAFLGRA